MAFTGTFSTLEKCQFYGESHFQKSRNGNVTKSIPRRQFVTLPVGPQLQALWHHPTMVAKLRDHLRRTREALTDRNKKSGIQDYYDLC